MRFAGLCKVDDGYVSFLNSISDDLYSLLQRLTMPLNSQAETLRIRDLRQMVSLVDIPGSNREG